MKSYIFILSRSSCLKLFILLIPELFDAVEIKGNGFIEASRDFVDTSSISDMERTDVANLAN